MKKIMMLMVIGVCLSGCSSIELGLKDLKSDTIGINRKVTLYSCSGSIIREWNGRFTIDNSGDSLSFVVNGKKMLVTGTYIVEEL